MAAEVAEGLSSTPKYLPSKYFYDAEGDALFRRIMQLPQYYPTRCEYEILSAESGNIWNAIAGSRNTHIIELGAGDGSKTKLLLQHAKAGGISFTYHPVDISPNTLDVLHENLGGLGEILPLIDDYSEILQTDTFRNIPDKLVLFLGSTIGNFTQEAREQWFREVSAAMNTGDYLLIGFDLVKDPQTILDAYNDPFGVTRAFNLNLLTILNRELGADFQHSDFYHFPVYDPQISAAKSFIVSSKQQDVYLQHIDRSFRFEAGEAIFTEISQKFTAHDIAEMAAIGNFTIVETYKDCKHWFADVLFRKG